jgi:uncharacterized repeat protein (TIGR03803 family)
LKDFAGPKRSSYDIVRSRIKLIEVNMSMRTPPNICKVMVFLILFVTTMWGSPKEKILHSFANNPRGENPYGSLVFDLSGNLYGATANGGTKQAGVVFELALQTDGHWRENVLSSFNGTSGGCCPFVGLVIDATGNLYGVGVAGGDLNECQGGCGVVFEVSRKSGAGWKQTTLYRFHGPSKKDGLLPQASLIVDNLGSLYGTTYLGGVYDQGTVYKVTPDTNGR